ncbi:MAG TPA: hypothetical protein DCY13_14680 [Verrucomicrobiales bacterium]|nr:hypothetical protein [Verrucomicrobiales bacterium]
MTRIFKAFAVAVAIVAGNLGFKLAAQEGDPVEGARIAAELRSIRPAEETRWRGEFKQKAADGSRISIPVTCDILIQSNRWLASYVTQALPGRMAEKLVIVRSDDGSTEYLHWQAGDDGAFPLEPRRLTGAAAAIPFAGTDFLLTDFGLEFLRWPTQKLLPGEMRRGFPCYVLESVNPRPDASYSLVRSWIEKEHLGLMLAEAVGPTGEHFKEFTAGSFVKDAEGNYQLKDMEMRTRGTGWTRLEFDIEGK